MAKTKSRCDRVLLVTARPVPRAVWEFELAKAGLVVTRAANATEAFRVAEEKHFDLVITDFKTPVGSGVDLARQLRYSGHYDATPIILLADEQAELDLAFLRSHLWLLVMREPCNVGEIVERISHQLAMHQASCCAEQL